MRSVTISPIETFGRQSGVVSPTAITGVPSAERLDEWLTQDIDRSVDYPPNDYLFRCPGCGESPFLVTQWCGKTVGFLSQQYFSCKHKQTGFLCNKVRPPVSA